MSTSTSGQYGVSNPPPTCDFTHSNVTAPPNTGNRSCTASNIADVAGPMYYHCCSGQTPVLYNGACQLWCNITDDYLYRKDGNSSVLTTEFSACIDGVIAGQNKGGTVRQYNVTCFAPESKSTTGGKTGGADVSVKLSGLLLTALVGVAAFAPSFWLV